MPTPTETRRTHSGRILTVDVLTFTDDSGRAVEREVVRHPGAVVILPVLDDDSIVMIQNHRVAIGRRLWELPAGTLEPDEPVDEAAARELEEETGYRAARLEGLGGFFTSPGFLDERLEVFVARDLTPTRQTLDAGEDITVSVLKRTEVLAMIDDGRICDAKTIAAILLFDRRERSGANGS